MGKILTKIIIEGHQQLEQAMHEATIDLTKELKDNDNDYVYLQSNQYIIIEVVES